MKQIFKVLGLVVSILLISTMMTSCSAEKKPQPKNGNWIICLSCGATGYEYYYLNGLISKKCKECHGCGYKLGHFHVDNNYPWNECDVCGKYMYD